MQNSFTTVFENSLLAMNYQIVKNCISDNNLGLFLIQGLFETTDPFNFIIQFFSNKSVLI